MEHCKTIVVNELPYSLLTRAKGCGLTMPEVAIQWAIANKAVTSVLVGARNTKELKANVKAVENPLPDDTVEKLNRATKRLMEKMSPGFDYDESKKNDRT